MSTPSEKPVVEPPPGGQDAGLHERALHFRIRQQEILSELGVLALQGAGFSELLDRTVRIRETGESAVVYDAAIEQVRTRDWAVTKLAVIEGARRFRRPVPTPSFDTERPAAAS